MPGTVTIPSTVLSNGVRTFGPANVADADTEAVLSIDRTVAGGFNSLTGTTTVEMTVEQSNDSGTTWFLIVDGIISGGLFPAPKGAPGNATTAGVGAFYAPGTGRQVRAKMTTAGGPVTVQGSLTIS